MPPAPRSTQSTAPPDSDSLRAPSALKGKAKDNGGPLQRGSACLACRKRKLKCDAAKPACQQCMRAGHAHECSYDNGKALSKTQVLQRRIAQLEEKLAQLQGKGTVGSPSSTTSSLAGDLTIGSSSASPPIRGPGTGAGDTRHEQQQQQQQRSQDDLFQDPLSSFPQLHSHSSSDQSSDFAPISSSPFTPALYPDSGSSTSDFGSGTLSPNIVNLGKQIMNAPYSSKPSAEAYDINAAPWAAPLGSNGTTITAGQLDYQSSLYTPPSLAGSFQLEDPLALAPSSLDNCDIWTSNPQFRSSFIRGTTHCITAHAEGRRYLLSLFLPYRRRCYFDVHVPRFLQSLEDPNPKNRPHPCLMDAIYLLGCYVSKSDDIRQFEPGLLSKARQGLCDSLEHSDRLWNFVQASCLIAFYLYQNGRFIEAYHQTCQVARFAVSCGLHQISSPFWPESARDRGRMQAPWTVTNMSVRRAGSMLDPAKDQIEVGERILAFWHIFLLDRCGSIMTNLPAALPDECDSFSQIETVWPRTLEEYEQGQVYEADYGTVRYLYQPESPMQAGRADTIFTLRLKASALFERASRLGARYSHTMTENTWGLFRSVDFAISRFSSTLPYVRNSGSMGEIPPNGAGNGGGNGVSGVPPLVNAQLVFVHTLALTATMRLHYVAALEDHISYSKRLQAAEAAVLVANELVGTDVDYSEFDMLLGHCWKTACDVLNMERGRLTTDAEAAVIDNKMDIIIAQMRALERVFPLTGFQITEVLQSRQLPGI